MTRLLKAAALVIAVLLALALAPVFSATARADSGYDPTFPDFSGDPILSADGNFYYVHFYTDSNDTVVSPNVDITSYIGSASDLTVPASLGGFPVESILNNTFGSYGSSANVKDVTVSEGIQYLGDLVFGDCDTLERVSLPSTLNAFSLGEFKGCPLLSEIDVAAGNAYYSSISGVLLSNDATALLLYPPKKADTSFSIPDSVTEIADDAFDGAENLTSVSIPLQVTAMGTPGNGFDVGGSEIFHGCKNLAAITVDASNAAFSSQDGVLYNKDQSALIKYPAGKADTEFTIPDGVQTIGVDAFSGVQKLETLHISSGVTTFASNGYFGAVENPFNCCPMLSVITVADGNTAFAAQGNVLFSADLKTLYCYPEGRAGDASAGHYPLTAKKDDLKRLRALQSKLDDLKGLEKSLPQAVVDSMRQSIRNSMKELLKGKTSAAAGIIADATGNYDIPDTTQSIVSWAFGGAKLSIVTIPDSVGAGGGTISDLAFQDAAGVSIRANTDSPAHRYAVMHSIPFIALDPETDDFTYDLSGNNAIITGYTGSDTAITIPAQIDGHKVTGIADDAFMDFGDGSDSEVVLTSVAIPDTVISIGADAFCGCYGLVSVKIPDSVQSIGACCFEECWDLQSVRLPSGITSLADGVFYDCESLADITLPSGIQSLGEECFSGCENLREIKLPASLTLLGESCFENCSSLLDISLPAGVKSLPDSSFFSCSGLETVELPASLQSIGDACFEMCSSLKNISIPKTVQVIGMVAFYGCDALESISVDADNPDYISDGGALYDKDMTALICYPAAIAGTSFSIPAGVTTIDEGAFYGNCPLLSITIGPQVTSIGDFAFETNKLREIIVDPANTRFANCLNGGASDGVLYSLTDNAIDQILCYPAAKPDQEYSIPLGVRTITPTVFEGRLFETVNIPASVAAIVADEESVFSVSPFAMCENLLNINVDPANIKFASVDGVLMNKAKTAILQFPIARTGSYTIPGTVTAVADCAFLGLRLSSVSFPASIKNLGVFSFSLSDTFKMAVFYGIPYNTDTSFAPFEELSHDFKVYYHIKKASAWKSFHSYPKQPFCTLTLNYQDADANAAVVAPIQAAPNASSGRISEPMPEPTRADYVFLGWYKEATCKHPWTFTKDKVSNDIQLFAKWEIVSAISGVQGTPQTYNSILVSWTALSGAAGYEVSRSTNQSSGFKVLGTVSAAAYTDKTAVTGTPYYYRVRAYIKYGSIKYYGPNSTVSASVATILAKPLSVKAMRLSATSVKVSWGKVAGATKYEIRQYIGSPSGSYKSFFSTSGSYTDKKLTTGAQYSYVVVAYRKVGSKWVTSDPSDPVSATP